MGGWSAATSASCRSDPARASTSTAPLRHPAVADARADLAATLASVARVLRPGGSSDSISSPDLPRWSEYRRRASLEGRTDAKTTVTLIESVRQDRRRKLTIFDQEYVERRGRERTVHRFALTFRTLSVPQMVRRLENAGFVIQALLGDYQGGPWDERADVWVILARKKSS